jgi:hypothetical protein
MYRFSGWNGGMCLVATFFVVKTPGDESLFLWNLGARDIF